MGDFGRIRKICELRSMSIAELSRRINISQNQLHNIMKTGKTTIETIEGISKILEISPAVFWSSESINKFLLDINGKYVSINTEAGEMDLKKEIDELKNQLLGCRGDVIKLLEQKHGISQDKKR